MNKDTVTGIVGALLLVSAMVGVFLYERGQAVGLGEESTPTLELATIVGPSAGGSVALGGDASEDVTIDQANLTLVTFTLKWTAQNGQDTLRLTVQPPEGVPEGNVSEPEDDGTIQVTVAVPNPEPSAEPQTLGVGTWRVTVEFLEASGIGPGQVPVQQDQSVEWTVTTDLTAWAPAE